LKKKASVLHVYETIFMGNNQNNVDVRNNVVSSSLFDTAAATNKKKLN
jgi:hypothetical protein